MNTAWFCLAPLLDLAGKPEYADQFDEALRRVAERIQEHCVFVDRIKMLEAELTDTPCLSGSNTQMLKATRC